MKLNEITIRGFRGFNEERTIPIHERITLISAPNSHGKTSVSEAFEWLFYGTTSKVALADSKDEYKGSYRNIHFLEPQAPIVRVSIQDGSSNIELSGTLSGASQILRVDGTVVESWPFATQLGVAPKPFILQHALKDLLLAAPVDRFTRFAALLGFEDLTRVHKDLMAFCTRAPLPISAKTLIADVDGLLLKVDADSQLSHLARALKKGFAQLEESRGLINQHARKLVSTGTPDNGLLSALIRQRDQAVLNVFKGTVSVDAFTVEELAALDQSEKDMVSKVAEEAVALFGELLKQGTQHRILLESRFFELGIELLQGELTQCPFCARALDGDSSSHIREHGELLKQRRLSATTLEKTQGDIQTLLNDFDHRISDYYKRLASRLKALLEARGQSQLLQSLLAGDNAKHFLAITEASNELSEAILKFQESGKSLRAAVKQTRESSQKPISDLNTIVELGEALGDYVTAGRTVGTGISKHLPSLSAAQRALIEQVNVAAGTRTISLLIEVLENDRRIEKRLKLATMIDGLRDLKGSIDTFVTKIMLDAISVELAEDVMHWYKQIRTTGDPNVHFSGFDMKKTAQGGRVQIRASSYGKDLVSAVSSLSESKLNALGLCISIAVNLREISPFEFVIIDDPIQSWDKDHETQFIGIVRELVQRGKQVILLSHNGEWVRQVRTQCADLNGMFYEITGYMESGPIIKSLPWVAPKQRLSTILAIIDDQTADSVRLQQAEEELRQVIHELACKLYEVVKGSPKNPASLNAEKVHKILTECGLSLELVNKIRAMFQTIDDAHHSGTAYSPNRQKLQQYYQTTVQLQKAIEARTKEVSLPVC